MSAGRWLLVIVGAATGACTEPPPVWTPAELTLLSTLSPVGEVPPARENEHADSPAAAALGRRLFFDRGLSSTGRVACATCHAPDRYFTDGRHVALGVAQGRRHTPTLLGVAGLSFLGWDGHTDTVWAQILVALSDPAEHDLTADAVTARVRERHQDAYVAAFGGGSFVATGLEGDPDVVLVDVAKALEAYLRTLVPRPAPFDHYVAALQRGDDHGGGSLSREAQRGLAAFLREGCVACHHGPWLTDGSFHNLGLPPALGVSDMDPGRSRGAHRVKASPWRCRDCDELRFLDPEFADFAGAFKTPTLRNVAETAPYMHTGQFTSLESVVEFYRKLPGAPRIGRRDPQLRPLGSRVSPRELVAFLRSLTSARPDDGSELEDDGEGG